MKVSQYQFRLIFFFFPLMMKTELIDHEVSLFSTFKLYCSVQTDRIFFLLEC